MNIHLHPRLTATDQAIILKYLLNPRALSKDDWAVALAAFDLLSACRIEQNGKKRTFAQFYEDVFDRPHASVLIGELLTIEDVEGEGARQAAAMGRQVWANEVKVMNDQPKNFNELTPEEFDQVLTCAASPELHDLAAEDFFTALAAIDAETPRETVELTATVKNGKLIFLEPAPLHAHDNEIQLGSQRVVITLVPETVGQFGQ